MFLEAFAGVLEKGLLYRILSAVWHSVSWKDLCWAKYVLIVFERFLRMSLEQLGSQADLGGGLDYL